MQFKSIVVALATLAMVNAEAEPRRRRPVARPPVCGGDTEAACCQTDTVYPSGYESSTNCELPQSSKCDFY